MRAPSPRPRTPPPVAELPLSPRADGAPRTPPPVLPHDPGPTAEPQGWMWKRGSLTGRWVRRWYYLRSGRLFSMRHPAEEGGGHAVSSKPLKYVVAEKVGAGTFARAREREVGGRPSAAESRSASGPRLTFARALPARVRSAACARPRLVEARR